MTGRDVSKRRRFFSITACVLLMLSSLLVGISIQIPNAKAVDHTVGNLDINVLNDWGRILLPIRWNGLRQTVEDTLMPPIGFIGLVVDHDDYDHTPGSEDIADSFDSWPYVSADDFQMNKPISMIIDNGTTQKSYGAFQNEGLGTGFADDILINHRSGLW